MTPSRDARLLLAAVAALGFWLALTWGIEILAVRGKLLPHYLLRVQDMPALLLGMAGLGAGALWLWKELADEADSGRWARDGRIVLACSLLFALVAWAGVRWVMEAYPLSRDEEVARMGAAQLARGIWGQPIPPEWAEYRRALMPEFFLPFGADRFFTPAYLPLNSAWQALWAWLGSEALAGPAFLLIGLISLWRIALRLFPERPDAVAVTLLMALGSTQLLATGMTAYAMTGHFALNMLWLALVLRGGALGHGLAGLVALALGGLHQWHFPLVFLVPFLLWFALQRRWAVLVFHGIVLALVVAIWAKLWPAMMLDVLGPPADVQPAAGVGHKLESLFGRLTKWRPLLHVARFLAWNHLLLLPLVALGLCWLADRWREAAKGAHVALPLAAGALGMAALAIDQGYGWGYRYLHGFLGSFALLAGYGWLMLDRRSLRAVWAGSLATAACAAFLLVRMHDYVAPFARSHAAILASKADVVIVDARDGRFATDLVRGREGDPLARPKVMSIGWLNAEKIDRLCGRYRIALFDKRAFLPLGVSPVHWDNAHIARLRAQMAETGCGTPIVPVAPAAR